MKKTEPLGTKSGCGSRGGRGDPPAPNVRQAAWLGSQPAKPSPCARKGSRPGRPRDELKLAAVLDAAARRFCSMGYERTSMDAIAAEASVSKATIYVYFNTKERLCEMAVSHALARHFAILDTLALELDERDRSLVRLGTTIAHLVFHPVSLGLHRLALETRTSAISERIYEGGVARIIEVVTGFFVGSGLASEVGTVGARRLASQYLSLFASEGYFRAIVDPTAVNPETAEVVAQEATSFLRLAASRNR